MKRPAYYNEIDPFAAEMLRNLIKAGHIAPGDVDERSILDVCPDDLRGYRQCHFFAGVGVWSYALRLAGWPDDREIWSGSCPCQPFSVAGMGGGFSDERHLWPFFYHLIEQRGPAAVVGEQVASRDADPWVDLVHTDMEALGYAFGAVPFPSAGVGAPHIRDRLYWVAQSGGERRERGQGAALRRLANRDDAGRIESNDGTAGVGEVGLRLANADGNRQPPRGLPVRPGRQEQAPAIESGDGEARRLADADGIGRPGDERAQPGIRERADELGADRGGAIRSGPTNGFWRDADWLGCRDGKWRPVEPGTFPLAHGAPARVGRLRAYGNAINAEAARVFIEAVMLSLS